MRPTLRRQALTLTCANAYTRGVGFVLHLALARLMGAEALGVMELSHSAIMLAITPVTAGIPSAMSRLAAQRSAEDARSVLRAGLSLAMRMAWVLAPALAILSPLWAWLLGDMRTIPAILTSAPDVFLLGLCAAYCGYCYGMSDTLMPAMNECAEQTIRVALTFALLLGLPRLSTAWRAALPGISEALAGAAVLLMFRRTLPCPAMPVSKPLRQEIFRLAAPMTASRLCQTGMRALHAVLLPVCLRRSGLSGAAATAQFGLLNGMAMPLMMLPGVITGAMCMIATPAVSRQEAHPTRLRQTTRKLLWGAAAVGCSSAVLLVLLSDVIGRGLYGEAALVPLLRVLCPLTVILSVQQVLMGILTGLGLQRKTLTGAIAGSALTLLITALLCPLPHWRLFGACAALLAGHLLRLLWCAHVAYRALAQKKI